MTSIYGMLYFETDMPNQSSCKAMQLDRGLFYLATKKKFKEVPIVVSSVSIEQKKCGEESV